jgi:hypothetical protein
MSERREAMAVEPAKSGFLREAGLPSQPHVLGIP